MVQAKQKYISSQKNPIVEPTFCFSPTVVVVAPIFEAKVSLTCCLRRTNAKSSRKPVNASEGEGGDIGLTA